LINHILTYVAHITTQPLAIDARGHSGHNGFQVLLPPPAGVRQNDPAYSPTTIRSTAGQSSQDGDLQSLKRKETFMRLPIVRSAEASEEPAGADAIGSSLNSGVSLGVKTVV
jgi:hypothetical protein